MLGVFQDGPKNREQGEPAIKTGFSKVLMESSGTELTVRQAQSQQTPSESDLSPRFGVERRSVSFWSQPMLFEDLPQPTE